MAGETILVIDDQAEISELIEHYLKQDGYRVIAMNTSHRFAHIVEQVKPALIILDIMLPGQDGIEVCKELRKKTNIPVIFISAKKDDYDKILALGVGGDDYLTKPFSPRELVARVKSHLRRSLMIPNDKTNDSILAFYNMEIDSGSHTVTVYGKKIVLSAKEFDLLHYLALHPNRIFSNEKLYNAIWGMNSFGDPRTVMVHISTLRKKIELDTSALEFITTTRGVGYKFVGRPAVV